MIGKLIKKEDHWFVRYKMDDDLIATDGGELSLHPDDAKYLYNIELCDSEVEFEIVPYMHDTFVARISEDQNFKNNIWLNELEISSHWKKSLNKYNLSQEVWQTIAGLYIGETHALKKSLEEQRYWMEKYISLKNQIKGLVN